MVGIEVTDWQLGIHTVMPSLCTCQPNINLPQEQTHITLTIMDGWISLNMGRESLCEHTNDFVSKLKCSFNYCFIACMVPLDIAVFRSTDLKLLSLILFWLYGISNLLPVIEHCFWSKKLFTLCLLPEFQNLDSADVLAWLFHIFAYLCGCGAPERVEMDH